MDEFIAKGAEAALYRRGDKLIKHRIEKRYRIPELDARLRKFRTQRETKILENAYGAGAPVPRIHEVDIEKKQITMQYLEGSLLKDIINSADSNRLIDVGKEIGGILQRLHEANIIHNDLTTSNMILHEGKIFLIDFGLAVTSTRIEDKAVDLVVFKRALKATHASSFDVIWDSLLSEYKRYSESKRVLARVAEIEKRARYTD